MRSEEIKDILWLLQHNKNLILQGAPGTGKTWIIPEIVTRLCGRIKKDDDPNRDEIEKNYKDLIEEGRVEFTTFHPSYDYDDFIEGWKPGKSAEAPLERVAGVFRSFCDKAKSALEDDQSDESEETEASDNEKFDKSADVWAVSLGGRHDKKLHEYCLNNNYIRIGWEDYEDVYAAIAEKRSGSTSLKNFYEEMKTGDYVVVPRGDSTIDAVGQIIEPKDPNHPIEMINDGLTDDRGDLNPRSRRVKWMWKGGVTDISAELGDNKGMQRVTVSRITGRFTPEKVRNFVEQKTKEARMAKHATVQKTAHEAKDDAYVFVIDEINRGNISKIFGELITLLEADKRFNGIKGTQVKLPSGDWFCVPDNVYVIGTMNTADRSIGCLDYALRRRFAFYPMKAQALEDPFNRPLFDKVRTIFYGKNNQPSEYLSSEFDPDDVMPGQSYFIAKDKDQKKFRFTYELKPLLEEYLRDGVLLENAREAIDNLVKD